MPRKARLDTPETLHHVILWGLERGPSRTTRRTGGLCKLPRPGGADGPLAGRHHGSNTRDPAKNGDVS
jgi:hypothetical protein